MRTITSPLVAAMTEVLVLAVDDVGDTAELPSHRRAAIEKIAEALRARAGARRRAGRARHILAEN